jgi:Serine dehydrogenase proteinase
LEIRKLIREMSIANPLWGAPRIHGELLKLGVDIGQTSVASTWSGDETRRPKAGGHSSAITLMGSLRWICSSCRQSRFACIAKIDDRFYCPISDARPSRRSSGRQASFLTRHLSADQANNALAETLTSGIWTHDYPIWASTAKSLGLPVNTNLR